MPAGTPLTRVFTAVPQSSAVYRMVAETWVCGLLADTVVKCPAGSPLATLLVSGPAWCMAP